MIRKMVFPLAAFLLTSACSATPGDAAYRSGQLEQAAELYWRGAQNGDEEAALKLGLLIENDAVESDRFGTATSWFVTACELGNVVGCHNAGVGLEYGKDGYEKNHEKAGDYYQKAAERGYMQSQYNLGSLYANQYLSGDVEGLTWLLLSQKKASLCSSEELCQWILKDPPGHIETLKQRMSDKQIEEAELKASAWSPTERS